MSVGGRDHRGNAHSSVGFSSPNPEATSEVPDCLRDFPDYPVNVSGAAAALLMPSECFPIRVRTEIMRRLRYRFDAASLRRTRREEGARRLLQVELCSACVLISNSFADRSAVFVML